MDANVELLRDSQTEIDNLRASIIGLDKKILLEKKNKIKEMAKAHRDTVTSDGLDADIKEIEQINSDIAKIDEAERKISEIEEKMRVASEKIENKNNRNKEIIMENETMKAEPVNMKRAFAKHVLFESTHRADCKLNDAERRALGIANTTTSETFSAPTADADGVNNGGVFIPQEVALDILREDELDSPIYRDIRTTAIKGKTKFPYKFSNSGAKTKAELSATENESVEWKVLSGVTGNYTDSIVLTFEEEAMAIDEFASYLIDLIRESMRELLISDYIYGSGTDDHVFGIATEAIDAKYAVADAENYRKILENGIKKLPIRKRTGAKIYVASDIYDGVTFEKDSNGNYILPVLNGQGFTRMSVFPVEMDPYLKPGDFIIGNIGKWYKANINKTMEIGLDVSNQNRTKTYTTHMMVTARAVPNSIVYGKKNS